MSTSLLTAVGSLLLLIPIVPLLTYVIGLLLPASHIVSRKRTLKGINQADLWQVLVDVEKHPEWRPRVNKIQLNHESCTDDRIVFQEHNTRNRTIVVIHVHQVPYSRLLRILQEIPTFSGSWTFELEPVISDTATAPNTDVDQKKENKEEQEEEHQDQVDLKITQQGVIKKPLLRVIYMLVLGLERRIDIFLDDLERKIQNQQQHDNHQIHISTTTIDQMTPTNIGVMDYSIMSTSNLPKDDKEGDVKEGETTTASDTKELEREETLPPMESLTPSILDESKDISASSASLLSKDKNNSSGWDMVSEIYERTK
ncbi:hypothetical protein BDA99DRAFT_525989 [Phascolomyces articulosus]|uniref:Uncharacterized protein n=1 Tax=Phascolomyces articulosus TaxID=60185 RepID=A0AAD5JNL9_9FUNG|nr:hypothetical protein BDA99DRAFT_525989 [Phascolomyces articulosus]